MDDNEVKDNDVLPGDQGGFPDENAEEPSLVDQPIEEEKQEEEPEKPKRKFQVDGKTRINQLKRENYEVKHLAQVKEAEAAKLKLEVERLQKVADQNSQAAMTHYDEGIKLKIEQATMKLIKAHEEGDITAQAVATAEMAKAHAQQENINSWRTQQEYLKSSQNEPVKPAEEKPVVKEQPQRREMNEETESWIENNPWFDPQNDEYDADVSEEVQAYAVALDRKLMRTGNQDKILSKEYFEEIDRYIKNEILGEPEPPQQRTLSMKQTRASVAPVSQRSAQPTRDQATPTLSEADKMFIRNLGVSEKEFTDRVRDDRKKQSDKMQRMLNERGGYR